TAGRAAPKRKPVEKLMLDSTFGFKLFEGPMGMRGVFSSNSSDFSFEFRADSSDGALWWESDWPGSTSSDFLIIHLRKGQVNVAVNLGNDLLKSVSTSKPLDRGKWHRVAVE
ncbi:hypothetical protein ANCDUO_25379, partial [Ancylostoma duodenale]